MMARRCRRIPAGLQHRDHHHAAQVAAAAPRRSGEPGRCSDAVRPTKSTGLRRAAERRSFGPRASRRTWRGGVGLGGGHRRVRHAEHHASRSRNSRSPISRSKTTNPRAQARSHPAATRLADSIRTTSAAPASARAKPRNAPASPAHRTATAARSSISSRARRSRSARGAASHASHFASPSFFFTSVMRSAAQRFCSMEFE